jgi:hypothetical protein
MAVDQGWAQMIFEKKRKMQQRNPKINANNARGKTQTLLRPALLYMFYLFINSKRIFEHLKDKTIRSRKC